MGPHQYQILGASVQYYPTQQLVLNMKSQCCAKWHHHSLFLPVLENISHWETCWSLSNTTNVDCHFISTVPLSIKFQWPTKSLKDLGSIVIGSLSREGLKLEALMRREWNRALGRSVSLLPLAVMSFTEMGAKSRLPAVLMVLVFVDNLSCNRKLCVHSAYHFTHFVTHESLGVGAKGTSGYWAI